MITNAILSMLLAVFGAVIGALPTIPVPSWLDASGPIATVFQDAGLMGAWFPVGLVSTVLLAVLGFWAVGFTIRFARIVVSLFTGGGGGAA